jgi:hypothetical protein
MHEKAEGEERAREMREAWTTQQREKKFQVIERDLDRRATYVHGCRHEHRQWRDDSEGRRGGKEGGLRM